LLLCDLLFYLFFIIFNLFKFLSSFIDFNLRIFDVFLEIEFWYYDSFSLLPFLISWVVVIGLNVYWLLQKLGIVEDIGVVYKYLISWVIMRTWIWKMMSLSRHVMLLYRSSSAQIHSWMNAIHQNMVGDIHHRSCHYLTSHHLTFCQAFLGHIKALSNDHSDRIVRYCLLVVTLVGNGNDVAIRVDVVKSNFIVKWSIKNLFSLDY